MGNAEKKELMSVIDSGWYTESSKTKEFERMFASFIGTKHACAVTSGAAALYVGLKAMNIGIGDEVIVPDLTFVASPNSVEATGAKPVLVDIEKKALNLDLNKISKSINKKTKAIMPVDFNGRPVDMKILREFADKKGIKLIEDAAHAIGCYYNRRHLGTISDVGIFSFSTPKIITTGQGGMIVTNDRQIYERSMALKDFGREIGVKKEMKKSFSHSTIGFNFKFTEFQAAVGIAQMRKLQKRILKKRRMFKKYVDLLSNVQGIEFLKTDLKNVTPWMIDIFLKSSVKRGKLINYLEKKQIGTRIYYPPIHRLKPYRKTDREYKHASSISDRGLWLPSSVTLNDKEIVIVCNEIKRFFK
jgi:perosamine synthetase